MRYIIKAVCITLCCLMLGGCWNYRSLDEMDIVTGIAVDKNDSGLYQLTFEIIDTETEKGQLKAKYVESEGDTLFDAIRNSKRRLINKLYGGNMQTLIINRQVAETEGIGIIMEEILRDGEPRETMTVVISKEDSAKKLLMSKGIDSEIVSYEANDMVKEDGKTTASTVDVPLYKAYDAINGTGKSLTLPAMHCVKNDGETVVESDGMAFFKGDKLAGFLPADKTKYYLFLKNQVKGGVTSFAVSDPDKKVSLEIKDCKTSTDVSFEEGRLLVKLKVRVKFNVMEINSQLEITDKDMRKDLEKRAEAHLNNKISGFFKEIQEDEQIDIFGLGHEIYRKDPDLWRKLEKDWDKIFTNADIEVQTTADIRSAGVLKDY